jgi:type IX secretion system PorP/SprF family membrane protein
MIRKNILTAAGLTALVAFTGAKAFAQDIHFTQFDAAPLIINPAFTGGFNGTFRAATVYRDQWRSVTMPFVTYSASVDAPIIHDLSVDDYLAGGLQFYQDKAGDGNLSNTSVLASVAYHKFLGGGQTDPDKTLSVGFQGGYTSKSIDISKLYFGDEFTGTGWNGGSGGTQLNNKTNYWTINAGVAWSHRTSERFGYTIGVGANNLNQPHESLQKVENSEVGLGMRYTAQVGAIANINDRLSLRPALLYQSQSTAYEMLIGNEFNYALGNPEFRDVASTSVFAGIFYRNSDAIMVTAGIEFKGFRFGASYDYNTSSLKDASKGNGGFELSLRYIAPNPIDFARKLVFPCARF